MARDGRWQVSDTFPLIDHVRNGDTGNRPDVERLATGRRIERRAIEVDPPSAVRALDDESIEGGEV